MMCSWMAHARCPHARRICSYKAHTRCPHGQENLLLQSSYIPKRYVFKRPRPRPKWYRQDTPFDGRTPSEPVDMVRSALSHAWLHWKQVALLAGVIDESAWVSLHELHYKGLVDIFFDPNASPIDKKNMAIVKLSYCLLSSHCCIALHVACCYSSSAQFFCFCLLALAPAKAVLALALALPYRARVMLVASASPTRRTALLGGGLFTGFPVPIHMEWGSLHSAMLS